MKTLKLTQDFQPVALTIAAGVNEVEILVKDILGEKYEVPVQENLVMLDISQYILTKKKIINKLITGKAQ